MLQQITLESSQSYIILDALDECANRAELMDILETIAGWQLKKLHILLTSRRERDIEISLETLVDARNAIDLRAEMVDKDIRAYIDHRLSVDKNLKRWQKDRGIRQEIEAALMEKACGM